MMMPTGGVTLDNAYEWLDAGACALVIGGSLTSGSKNGDYKKVIETAREFRRIIDEYTKRV